MSSFIRSVRKLVACLVLILPLANCASGFSQFYHDDLNGWPIQGLPWLVPHDGEPKVVQSQNTNEDFLRMEEDGYILIGYSSFNDEAESFDSARWQARKVRAAVALVTMKYSHTAHGSRSFTTYDTVTSNHSGSYYGTYSSGNYYGATATKVPRTTNVSYSVDKYDHLATYWVKGKWGILGAHLVDLSADTRQKFERNRGVEVVSVEKGGPAYAADVMRGDVIVSIAGQDIEGLAPLADLLDKHAGTTTDVEVLRKDKRLTIPVLLRAVTESYLIIVSKRPSPLWQKLEMGMTKEQIRNIFGEPAEINNTTLRELWVYPGGDCLGSVFSMAMARLQRPQHRTLWRVNFPLALIQLCWGGQLPYRIGGADVVATKLLQGHTQFFRLLPLYYMFIQ